MSDQKPRSEYPLWVKMAVWGLPNRGAVWFFVWLSVACAAGCAIYGYWDRRFFAGLSLLVAALLYWRAIRWIDRHGAW